jgi:hypothetical protein
MNNLLLLYPIPIANSDNFYVIGSDFFGITMEQEMSISEIKALEKNHRIINMNSYDWLIQSTLFKYCPVLPLRSQFKIVDPDVKIIKEYMLKIATTPALDVEINALGNEHLRQNSVLVYAAVDGNRRIFIDIDVRVSQYTIENLKLVKAGYGIVLCEDLSEAPTDLKPLTYECPFALSSLLSFYSTSVFPIVKKEIVLESKKNSNVVADKVEIPLWAAVQLAEIGALISGATLDYSLIFDALPPVDSKGFIVLLKQQNSSQKSKEVKPAVTNVKNIFGKAKPGSPSYVATEDKRKEEKPKSYAELTAETTERSVLSEIIKMLSGGWYFNSQIKRHVKETTGIELSNTDLNKILYKNPGLFESKIDGSWSVKK